MSNAPFPTWHVTLFTLFPEMFPGPLGCSLAGKAREKGLWNYHTINIRDFAKDNYQTVDDTPYGGGAGMVLRPDVLGEAIESVIPRPARLLYPSPRGKPFSQNAACMLAKEKNIAIICGRFEGIDERLITEYALEEVSMGDYVLSGGEIAALAIMDACIRLLPGVVGNRETLAEESFGENPAYAGLLEYPLYTRPALWKGHSVPEVLRSGNHEAIHTWRKGQSYALTRKQRPDLWESFLEKGKP